MKPAALLLLSTACLPAADMKSSLAPTGTLRVTFLGGNPVQGRVDPATGVISGLVREITDELAKRLGVPSKITPSAGAREVLDTVKSGAADVGFLAFDATRAAEVAFSKPYALAYNSYIVPSSSALQTVASADRAGIRIAAQKGDSGELYLGRNLKQAELKSIAGLNPEQALKMLESHEIDAYAANRQRLSEMATRYPGLRIVKDNFFGVQQSLIVSMGDAGRIEYLNQFIDSVRTSGLLKGAIERAKLNGVEVAP
jgi:polar amino acid transport system substrate-binding protein